MLFIKNDLFSDELVGMARELAECAKVCILLTINLQVFQGPAHAVKSVAALDRPMKGVQPES